jgi:hypothetical protein
MLARYDWLRRCRKGSELLATLNLAAARPGLFSPDDGPGPPLTLFHRPCRRCWIYPPGDGGESPYCAACQAVISGEHDARGHVRRTVLVWGFVNRVPDRLYPSSSAACRIRGAHVADDQRFLLALDRRSLKVWLQELLLYHGTGLKGLLQVFPTTGDSPRGCMGDVLAKAAHLEARYPADLLRVRFFSNAYHLFAADRKGEAAGPVFDATEFLRFLEMAAVFRSLLRPEGQQMLHELFDLTDPQEERFYWGRFMGFLSPEARDMLDAWKIRQWPKPQVRLLYDLLDYVVYTV